jgi:CHAD domain-containing protein
MESQYIKTIFSSFEKNLDEIHDPQKKVEAIHDCRVALKQIRFFSDWFLDKGFKLNEKGREMVQEIFKKLGNIRDVEITAELSVKGNFGRFRDQAGFDRYLSQTEENFTNILKIS